MLNSSGFDAVVIGAGISGLACASELARRGHSVLVLERHARAGLETSSHNSEVVHAGLYYPPDSLKAQSCVEGRERLYERCARFAIDHRRVGKLIVASEASEIAALERIRECALACGAVDGDSLISLGSAALQAHDARLRGVAALFSVNSGIVDSQALLQSHVVELEAVGGVVAYHHEVVGLERSGASWCVYSRSAGAAESEEAFEVDAPLVVNAAGLAADRIAALAGVDVDARRWRLHFCKGDYFALAPGVAAPTRHLVYPVPSGAGLGVHVTLDLGGRMRFGPDASYVDAVSYDVEASKAAGFRERVARYLPEARDWPLKAWLPEMSGVRPKLQGEGEAFRDFVVESPPETPGMLHMLGIESPGLTASEALARRACDVLGA